MKILIPRKIFFGLLSLFQAPILHMECYLAVHSINKTCRKKCVGDFALPPLLPHPPLFFLLPFNYWVGETLFWNCWEHWADLFTHIPPLISPDVSGTFCLAFVRSTTQMTIATLAKPCTLPVTRCRECHDSFVLKSIPLLTHYLTSDLNKPVLIRK